MNRETSEAIEKRTDKELLNDRRRKLPLFHAPVILYDRRKPKCNVGKGNITDSLTATYWG